jgi:hypothetical protein
MGIRANQGLYGGFQYFEITRLTDPVNMGGGLVILEGDLNPYDYSNVPPSVSINTLGGTWESIMFRSGYDTANAVYGYAVDYRGDNPIVYWIVNDVVIDETVMEDVFVPIYPMLYGNETYEGEPYDESINFGASAFSLDVCTALANHGVDTTELDVGWGDVNATPCP